MEPKDLTPEEQEERLRRTQDPAAESADPSRPDPEWLADAKLDSALDELYEDREPAEKEASPEELRESLNNFIRWLALAAAFVIFVCFGVAAIMYFDHMQKVTQQESSAESEEPVYHIRERFGVVTAVNGTVVTVYNAQDGQSERIDLAGAKKLTDEYGLEIELEEVVVGSIVQVQINEGEGVAELFRFTAQAEHLNRVTGLSFHQQPERGLPGEDDPEGAGAPSAMTRTLTVEGRSYTYDEKLLLFYHGEILKPEQLNERMVVNVNALDGHIYTMDVLCGEGYIKLNSIPQDYLDTTLVLTPALGDEQRVVLTQELRQIPATEGVNRYRAEDEAGNVLAEGEIYVQGAGKNVLLTLLPLQKQSGVIVFRINVKTASIEIEGETYGNGDEIQLPYGEYTATVSATGYRSADIEVRVDQPYCLVDVNINALRSQLILSSSYSGVVVRIGDAAPITLRGTSVTVPLEAGTYHIVAELEGYEPLELTVTLRANEADQVLFLTSFKKIMEPESSEPEPSEPESSEPEPSELEESESSEPEPDESEESHEDAESREEPAQSPVRPAAEDPRPVPEAEKQN